MEKHRIGSSLPVSSKGCASVLVCFNRGETVHICYDITSFPGMADPESPGIPPTQALVEYLTHTHVLLEMPPSVEYLNEAVSVYNSKRIGSKFSGDAPLAYFPTDVPAEGDSELEQEEDSAGVEGGEEEDAEEEGGVNAYCGTAGCTKTYHHTHVGKFFVVVSNSIVVFEFYRRGRERQCVRIGAEGWRGSSVQEFL